MSCGVSSWGYWWSEGRLQPLQERLRGGGGQSTSDEGQEHKFHIPVHGRQGRCKYPILREEGRKAMREFDVRVRFPEVQLTKRPVVKKLRVVGRAS